MGAATQPMADDQTQNEQKPLAVVTETEVAKEVKAIPPEASEDKLAEMVDMKVEKIDPEVQKKASEFADALLSDRYTAQQKRDAIDNMGLETQKSVAKSRMLDTQIRQIAVDADTGGPIANALVDLTDRVTELDPINFFSKNGVLRVIGKIPGFGRNIKTFFQRYQTASGFIDQIIESLENGREQLKRDNLTLANDQKNMLDSGERLKKAIQLGRLLDERMQSELQGLEPGTEKYQFVQGELLFPLRQRITDLLQSLAVNQQGYIAMEVIIRNNRELIRGVDRALTVTITAMQVAVTLAVALAHQKIVLRKIELLNTATSTMIEHAASMIKTQGVEIHKQASSSMLSMESLEKAFDDLKTSLDDISSFRQEALPVMQGNILKLESLSRAASTEIDRMIKGDEARKDLDQGLKIDIATN
ncbi:MAG: toxic anion resistance protein [Candidatus Poribacteria bacterium]